MISIKPKIAILSYYSGVLERGVETFVADLSARISKDFKVTIIQGGHSNHLEGDVQIKVTKSFKTSRKSSRGIIGKFYLDLESLKIMYFSLLSLKNIIGRNFNIVIATNGGWQTLIYRIATKMVGAKLVVIGEAGIGSDDAWNLLFRPDVFVAVTGAQRVWAERLTPENKIVRIPNGVNLSKFNAKIEPKKIKLAKPIAITAAALDPYKQIDLTIKAVAKAGNLSLLLLGDGAERGKIDSLGKRLLGNRYMRLLVPHNELASYLTAADVFTLASKTEAFGTAYIEALACNLPIVATNDKSRQEIIGDAGILTDPKNTRQYAKDLELAAKTNYGNKPTNQARKYAWDDVANKYIKLLKSLSK